MRQVSAAAAVCSGGSNVANRRNGNNHVIHMNGRTNANKRGPNQTAQTANNQACGRKVAAGTYASTLNQATGSVKWGNPQTARGNQAGPMNIITCSAHDGRTGNVR